MTKHGGGGLLYSKGVEIQAEKMHHHIPGCQVSFGNPKQEMLQFNPKHVCSEMSPTGFIKINVLLSNALQPGPNHVYSDLNSSDSIGNYCAQISWLAPSHYLLHPPPWPIIQRKPKHWCRAFPGLFRIQGIAGLIFLKPWQGSCTFNTIWQTEIQQMKPPQHENLRKVTASPVGFSAYNTDVRGIRTIPGGASIF